LSNVGAELANAADHLQQSGSETPRLDAELLLCRVLGTDRAGLVMRSEDQMSADDRTLYLALLTRRVKHEPIAYILGKQAFRNLELMVDPRVLIPRPETEFLVEAALGLPQGSRVIDVGTGSGAVALALKDERPDLRITATDLSSGALSVTRMNIQRLRLDLSLIMSDLLLDVTGDFDAVVANLPYVESNTQLQPDVLEYEPKRALFGGVDGLDLVRRLIAEAAQRQPVKFIALEIGQGQAAATAELLTAAGFASTETIKDLAAIDRIVVGRR
jgi:release factor glutamine methyltransferase